MVVNCVIVHGCPEDEEKAMDLERRTYDEHWLSWTKKELENKGVETFTPLMPDPWRPDYDKWKSEFDKFDINENTILIGHSCGCAFLVRWLGDTSKKVKKLILVAPWKIPYGEGEKLKIKKKFYEYGISENIKSDVKDIVIFTADDEEEDGKRSAKIFHDALGGKIIELKGHGHYCYDDMGTHEFPELLEEVLR